MDIWWWQYTVELWDERENEEKTVSGLTFGETLTDAVKNLDAYYGDAILNIKCFKSLDDGHCFEFGSPATDDFDFEITPKKV